MRPHAAQWTLKLTASSISALLQLPLNLPAVFIVWSVVKKLAAVWKWDTRRSRFTDVFTDDWYFRGTTLNTYLQNHRTQSPYNLCRCLAGSPTWLWPWGVPVPGLALFCWNIWRFHQRKRVQKQMRDVWSSLSPDHPRASITHSRVFGLNEFDVVVNAPIDFIIFFPCQLLFQREHSKMWQVKAEVSSICVSLGDTGEEARFSHLFPLKCFYWLELLKNTRHYPETPPIAPVPSSVQIMIKCTFFYDCISPQTEWTVSTKTAMDCCQHLFSVLPLGFSDSSQRWPEHHFPSQCPADMSQLHPCPLVLLVSF